MSRRRSRGCRTCKSRRIKCDERQPICYQCEKSNRFCTGPDSPFKYQYGDPAQRDALARALDSATTPLRVYKSGACPSDYSRSKGLSRKYSPRQLPLSEADVLSFNFISTLQDDSSVGIRLLHLGIFFQYLPPLISHSKSLDLSISCILGTYNSIVRGEPRDTVARVTQLGHAIRNLRSELTDPRATTSLVLASALLLSAHHALDMTLLMSYPALADGAARLLEAIGPRGLKTDFELALFSVHASDIILHRLVLGQSCFLADPDWVALIRSTGVGRPMDEQIMAELWAAMAAAPNAIARLRKELRQVNHDEQECLEILTQLFEIRENILAQSDMVESLCSSPSVYRLCTPGFASSLVTKKNTSPDELYLACSVIKAINFYKSSVILINTAIFRILLHPAISVCTSPSQSTTMKELEAQSRMAADWILSSLPYVRTTQPLGQLYMPYTGALVYGMLSSHIDRARLVLDMNEMMENVGMKYTDFIMLAIFEAATGGTGDSLRAQSMM